MKGYVFFEIAKIVTCDLMLLLKIPLPQNFINYFKDLFLIYKRFYNHACCIKFSNFINLFKKM